MSDDPAQEPSVAIDLSRRKETAGGGVVRASMAGARRVARPYVTMTRIALARLARSRLARAGAVVLACLGLAGIFADLLASDLPVACRFRGVVYLLPNVTRPPALAGTDCARMERDHDRGDWLFAPLVAYGPDERGDATDVLRPPGSGDHPLGTDAFGRDVFARIVHGARTTLSLGIGTSLLLVAIGVALGTLAGFAGGLVDALVSRAVESLTAVPTLVLALVVSAMVPHPTTATLFWIIALTRWTELARLVRAEVLLALAADYVVAARALGSSPSRVLWRHIMPNAIGPAIVAAAFGVASVVLVEASIHFLRVSSPDTIASWGESMGEARAHAEGWWLLVFPGVALLATLVALNLVGEAARDALDPRLRGVGEELTEAMRG